MTTSNNGTGLVDTNVLVYAADTASPFHAACKALRTKGMKGQSNLCVCPQVLMEFFAVITHPKRVTAPRKPKEAIDEIKKYLKSQRITKIYPAEEVTEKVLELFRKHRVKGPEIFDLQLVATMLVNNVTKIYTYNKEHFSRYKEIEVWTP